jgi:SAM-dependent methyltransferase
MRRLRSILGRRSEDGPQREPGWHREAVGGLWEEMGRLQFEYLVERGLRPEHRLLDIGCGSLRGGLHFIRYLHEDRYVGIDRDPDLLEAGREELRLAHLEAKRPRLVEMDDFGLARLGQRFDIALAQSVFTHLPLNSIIRCLMAVEEVLEPGGRFFATFFENPEGKRRVEPIHHRTATGEELVTYFDRDPYHYDVDTFRWICRDTRLDVTPMGEWGHPRDQRMLLFQAR